MTPASYYHGFIEGRGHEWMLGPGSDPNRDRGGPDGFRIEYLDGVFAPREYPDSAEIGYTCNEVKQGLAALVRVNGPQAHGKIWTLIAFWDRSGDKRGASNTAFVCAGCLSFDQVVAQTRRDFPKIWARIDAAGIDVRPYVS